MSKATPINSVNGSHSDAAKIAADIITRGQIVPDLAGLLCHFPHAILQAIAADVQPELLPDSEAGEVLRGFFQIPPLASAKTGAPDADTIKQQLEAWATQAKAQRAHIAGHLPSGLTADSARAVFAIVAGHLAKQQRPRRVLNLKDIFERPRLKFLIQDILLERGTSVLSADYGAFKSFTVLDMALCVATGKPWHGHEVKRGAVVYVIAEGAYTTADRVRAWLIRYQLEIPENFYLLETGVQIADAGQRAEFLEEIRDLNPTFVIFDTLSKCNAGRDENDTGAMTLFNAAMRSISDELGAQVLAVHHNNKSGTARGNVSLPADADASITLEKSAGRVVTVKCDRVKGADFAAIPLIGRIVELPEMDEYGRPVTSLVFELTDAPIVPEAVGKSDATRERILKVLKTHPDFRGRARKGALQKECEKFVKKSTFYDHINAMEGAQIRYDNWGFIEFSDLSDLSDSEKSDAGNVSGLSGVPLGTGKTGKPAKASKRGETADSEPYQAPAGVAFMLTNRMRADLAALGYSTDDIDQMTPQAAHDLIASGARKAEAEAVEVLD